MADKIREVEPGDLVSFVDAMGVPHAALVTSVHGPFGVWTQAESDQNVKLGGGELPVGEQKPVPSLNVVYVSADPSKEDQYGRQIERETSVVHETNQSAHGMFWR